MVLEGTERFDLSWLPAAGSMHASMTAVVKTVMSAADSPTTMRELNENLFSVAEVTSIE